MEQRLEGKQEQEGEKGQGTGSGATLPLWREATAATGEQPTLSSKQSSDNRTKTGLGVTLYRVTIVVRNMGWVDYDSSHSTVSLVLLGQMGIWLNRLGRWAKWWNI